jgi:hypothetical protein
MTATSMMLVADTEAFESVSETNIDLLTVDFFHVTEKHMDEVIAFAYKFAQTHHNCV